MVMEEYDVFQIFVSDKSWTNKRIRYVKEIYTALRQAILIFVLNEKALE